MIISSTDNCVDCVNQNGRYDFPFVISSTRTLATQSEDRVNIKWHLTSSGFYYKEMYMKVVTETNFVTVLFVLLCVCFSKYWKSYTWKDALVLKEDTLSVGATPSISVAKDQTVHPSSPYRGALYEARTSISHVRALLLNSSPTPIIYWPHWDRDNMATNFQVA